VFCKTVWSGLHILPDGYIRLCSIGQNTYPELDMQRCRDKDGNLMHILTHSIQDIMNSDKHREVRLFNVNNPTKWSPHCECCENREVITNYDRLHDNISRRIYLLKIDDDNVVSELAFKNNKIDQQGNINWMPSSLDIRFGNLCNQKCVMCGPVYSNQWYDEWFDYYGSMRQETNNQLKEIGVGKWSFSQDIKMNVTKDISSGKWINSYDSQWFEDPRWWIKFEEMAPHLKHIYITGGEPMVTPAHDEMLDRLIDSGFAKNIWLEYDTNASAINDKIVDRWKHFNKVEIRVSMDAIDNQYELIRFGGKWDKFTKNIKKLKEIEQDSNRKVRLLAATSCFQLLTMFSVHESEEWCRSVGVEYHIRFLTAPSQHSVISLNQDAKLELIDHYKSLQDKLSKAEIIVNFLQNNLSKSNESAITEFYRFMNYLDSTRNTKWISIFPELDSFLKTHHTAF
jgi:organic radical activating enzyme